MKVSQRSGSEGGESPNEASVGLANLGAWYGLTSLRGVLPERSQCQTLRPRDPSGPFPRTKPMSNLAATYRCGEIPERSQCQTLQPRHPSGPFPRTKPTCVTTPYVAKRLDAPPGPFPRTKPMSNLAAANRRGRFPERSQCQTLRATYRCGGKSPNEANVKPCGRAPSGPFPRTKPMSNLAGCRSRSRFSRTKPMSNLAGKPWLLGRGTERAGPHGTMTENHDRRPPLCPVPDYAEFPLVDPRNRLDYLPDSSFVI